tara:strand:- start:3693 stop:4310 length:618 start_codon:yes stop_codon:yes gene_type:complete
MYGMRDMDFVLKNRPIKIHFAGMWGHTNEMQQAGWDFSITESYDFHRSFSIACRHREAKMYMWTHPIRSEDIRRCIEQMDFIPSVQAVQCAHKVDFILHEMPKLMPMDFSERFMVDKKEIVSLEDLMPFQGINSENEIFVPEKKVLTIQEMLNAVVEEQAPKQKELRQKARKAQARQARHDAGSENSFSTDPHKDVKLKLISVAG